MSWSEAFLDQVADRVAERIRRETDYANRVFPNKLLFDEGEAAELLGIPRHVLKGTRERGEIRVPKVGKKYQYSRELLLDIARNGTTANF